MTLAESLYLNVYNTFALSFAILHICLQQEREHYEYVPKDGRIIHKQTGELIDTTQGSEKGKWIFVMSTTKKLYAGQVKIRWNKKLPYVLNYACIWVVCPSS